MTSDRPEPRDWRIIKRAIDLFNGILEGKYTYRPLYTVRRETTSTAVTVTSYVEWTEGKYT